jgi:hypothetical protein
MVALWLLFDVIYLLYGLRLLCEYLFHTPKDKYITDKTDDSEKVKPQSQPQPKLKDDTESPKYSTLDTDNLINDKINPAIASLHEEKIPLKSCLKRGVDVLEKASGKKKVHFEIQGGLST